MKEHLHLEEKSAFFESNSKYYKRLIVGIIRHFADEDGKLRIPEELFDNVPDNIGFEFSIEDGNDSFGNYFATREFEIIDNWKVSEDDDGGYEEDIDNVYFTATEPEKSNILTLVPNIEKKDDTI